MKEAIKGFMPASMLDWPGKLAAVLFIAGCNLRCPYCHNPDLVLDGSRHLPGIPWDELRAMLSRKRGWLDGVCITGGEPTLWEGLPSLVLNLRELGLEVKLDTNGTYPERLRVLIREDLIDAVSLDLKTSPRKYGLATGNGNPFGKVAESLELLLDSRIEVEFRCTAVPGLVELEDLLELAQLLQGRAGLVIQQFRPGNNLHPRYHDLQPYQDDLLMEWSRALGEIIPVSLRGLSAQAPPELRERMI